MSATRRTISAFQAPALIDLHPTLTRYALYEELSGTPVPPSRPGLQFCLEDGAIKYAEAEFQIQAPVRRRWTHEFADGLTGVAAGWETEDQIGKIIYVFAHVPAFVHANAWGRAGVPPVQFKVMANWIMWLSGHTRLGFLVLADKSMRVYEVEREEHVIERLQAGCASMLDAIQTQTPPPVDAKSEPETVAAPVPASDDAVPTDLDEVCRRWRDTTSIKATASNESALADAAADAATEVLKRTLAKGATHTVDGIRIIHNARTGRLIQEQVDGLYF